MMPDQKQDRPFKFALDEDVLGKDGAHTLSVILMDRSGSMMRFGSAPLEALNGHIAKLQEEPDASRASAAVVSFADDARVEVPHRTLREIPLLSEYEPDGRTRLHATIRDVLASLIDAVGRFGRKSGLQVVLAVFTDGEDSPRTDPSPARELAIQAQMIGFKLILVGIGVDAKKKAIEIGFPVDQALKVSESAEGVSRSMAHVTRVTSLTMSGVIPRSEYAPRN